MKKKHFVPLASAMIICTTFAAKHAVALTVVANLSFTESNYNLENVRNVFLGRTRSGAGNVPIVPVDQPESSAIWKEFAEKVLQKSPQQLKSYWNVRIFTGRGSPPLLRRNDQEVIEFVSTTPNGIGYVHDAAVTNNVKVLLVIP